MTLTPLDELAQRQSNPRTLRPRLTHCNSALAPD
ncbi:hypothetical protein HDE76_000777 [Rhodanobacter sp. ANJX3]|nr:hypothetical protein [Rhodanobacter sp. ANJX3]NYE27587.1 hypothetical protein [Rhodanobacter sp. K2T2]